jgi:hypothetical protein
MMQIIAMHRSKTPLRKDGEKHKRGPGGKKQIEEIQLYKR